ncbi:Hypothetical predicted protein, partial [Lecanosticta acicola]
MPATIDDMSTCDSNLDGKTKKDFNKLFRQLIEDDSESVRRESQIIHYNTNLNPIHLFGWLTDVSTWPACDDYCEVGYLIEDLLFKLKDGSLALEEVGLTHWCALSKAKRTNWKSMLRLLSKAVERPGRPKLDYLDASDVEFAAAAA